MTSVFAALLGLLMACGPAEKETRTVPSTPADSTVRVKVGAEKLLEEARQVFAGRKVAIVANHTSLVNGVHLVDTLKSLGVNIVRIFCPEHGFRGDHDAGQNVKSGKDEKTGIPLVSLYGNTKKPTPEMLKEVDLVVFDIQDVGTRFYTYISTMAYVMEACAEQNKSVIVCDRPNPNGWYVDGPVREDKFKSFVGMHPVPVVYGMTVGEYAKMVNGEGWLAGGKTCKLVVYSCEGYKHSMKWEETGLEWVAPSPNLATEYSAYLYPILCWYEGMPVSVGRGTDYAFTLVGAPWHQGYANMEKRDSVLHEGQPGTMKLHGLEMQYTTFTPKSLPGKATHPPFENKKCFGAKFLNRVDGKSLWLAGITLLLNFEAEYREARQTDPLFMPYFDTLAGNATLKEQVKKQMDAAEIYQSWQPAVEKFKSIRQKYLLYEE